MQYLVLMLVAGSLLLVRMFAAEPVAVEGNLTVLELHQLEAALDELKGGMSFDDVITILNKTELRGLRPP